MVPILETERLVLRAPIAEDFAASAAMWADPVVTRYVGGRPFTHEESWARFLRYAGLWAYLGYGYWIVESKGGEFVGEVGFADLKRELAPSLDGMPEQGWVFAASAHGKGYATEAVKAAIDWAKRTLEARNACCMIDIGNTASIRVAEKAGYAEFARTTYKEKPVILYWRPLRG